MNKLTFEVTDLNTLSFRLLVDGKPMIDTKGVDEDQLPAWDCKNGIPPFPPYDVQSVRMLVAACGCGEYGCGNTNAHIERQNGIVRLSDFQGVARSHIDAFEFDEAEYDQVSIAIAAIAAKRIAEWQAQQEKK
jgi:hypothetical protein